MAQQKSDDDILRQFMVRGNSVTASEPAQAPQKAAQHPSATQSQTVPSTVSETPQTTPAAAKPAPQKKPKATKPPRATKPKRQPGVADAQEIPASAASLGKCLSTDLVDKAQKAVYAAYKAAGGTKNKMRQGDAVAVLVASALGIPSNETYLTAPQKAVLQHYYEGVSDTDTLRAIRMRVQANTETMARLNRQIQVLQSLIAMLVCDRFAIHDPSVWDPNINNVSDIQFHDPSMVELIEAAKTALSERSHKEQMLNNPHRRRG